MSAASRSGSFGVWLLLAAAAAALGTALFNYFWAGSGIDHTAGGLLVCCSSALLLLAAWAQAQFRAPRWLNLFLAIALAIDIVGTGGAAYFLEAYGLVALMVIAGLGWIASMARAGGSSSGRAFAESGPVEARGRAA